MLRTIYVAACLGLITITGYAGEAMPKIFADDFNSYTNGMKLKVEYGKNIVVKGFSAVKVSDDSANATPYVTCTSSARRSSGTPTSTISFVPVSGIFELGFKLKGYSSTSYSDTVVVYSTSGEKLFVMRNVNSSLRIPGNQPLVFPEGTWTDVRLNFNMDLAENNVELYIDGSLRNRFTEKKLYKRNIARVGFGYLASVDDIIIAGDQSAVIQEFEKAASKLNRKIQRAEKRLAQLNDATPLVKAAYEWNLAHIHTTLTQADKSKNILLIQDDLKPHLDALLTALKKGSLSDRECTVLKRYLPRFSEENPYARGVFEDAAQFLDPAGDKRATKRNSYYDGLLAVYALSHPQSPYYKSPEMLHVALGFIEERIRVKSWVMHHHMAYILFTSVFPDLILSEIKMKYAHLLSEKAESNMQGLNKILNGDYVKDSWLNGQIWAIANVGLIGVATDNSEYVEWTDNAMKYLSLTLLPDGGTNYAHFTNECITYHHIAIKNSLYLWLFSGIDRAKEFSLATLKYSPLSGSMRGVSEHYSAPAWKHYWNQMGTGGIPELSAVSGEPFNNMMTSKRANILNAVLYEAGIRDGVNKVVNTSAAIAGSGVPKEVQWPDNDVIYDRNIIGTRANYGDFNYALFTRDASYYPGKTSGVKKNLTGGRANDSFAGLAILYSKEEMKDPQLRKQKGFRPNWPLNVAAQEFMIKVNGEDFNSVGIVDSETSISLTSNLSALSAKYTPAYGRYSRVKGAVSTQQWIMSKDSAMGLLSTELNEDMMLKSIIGSSKYISGRRWWGVRKELIQVDTNTFRYGGAKIRIHDTNFKGVEVTYTDTYDGNVKKVGVLNLKPEQSTGINGELQLYKKGTRYYYLIEVVPHWSEFADEVKMVQIEGISGFMYNNGDKSVAILHNPTESPKEIRYGLPAGSEQYSIHLGTDGAVDRDKYLNKHEFERLEDADSGNRAKAVSLPEIRTTIPCYRHVLLVGSNDPDDHDGTFRFYEDVFSLKVD